MPPVRTRTYAASVRLLALLPFAALTMCRSNRAPADARPAPRAVVDAGVAPSAPSVPAVADAGSARDVPEVDAGPPVTVIGRATVNRVRVAGATVEVVGGAGGSQVTGADGAFQFSLPVGQAQLLRGSRSGSRTLQEMVSSPTDFNGLTFDLLPDAEFAQALGALSITEDPAAGTLFIHYHLAPNTRLAAGLGATLSAAGGERFTLLGDRPVRQETTATTGELLLGVVNLPVGALTVTPVAPARVTCTPERGTATTRIDARTITNLSFRCR